MSSNDLILSEVLAMRTIVSSLTRFRPKWKLLPFAKQLDFGGELDAHDDNEKWWMITKWPAIGVCVSSACWERYTQKALTETVSHCAQSNQYMACALVLVISPISVNAIFGGNPWFEITNRSECCCFTLLHNIHAWELDCLESEPYYKIRKSRLHFCPTTSP